VEDGVLVAVVEIRPRLARKPLVIEVPRDFEGVLPHAVVHRGRLDAMPVEYFLKTMRYLGIAEDRKSNFCLTGGHGIPNPE
jgi:hypothetical protein